MLITDLLALLPLLAGSALAASADDWRSRSVYQVIVDRFAPPNGDSNTPCNTGDRKYCGGTWSTLVSKLDYIQGMGYDAVWISPTSLNIEGDTVYGQAYHGYWVTDQTKINPHFGTEDDLKSLSAALHDRGMYLMVDLAVNALASTNNNISSSNLNSPEDATLLFKKTEDYHPRCDIQWGNHQSEMNCWLATSGVALLDLDQSNSEVSDTLVNWAKEYVQEYGVDGFRVDASKHMPQDFQHRLCSTADTFCIGEVYGDDTSYAAEFQGPNAIDSVLGFSLMFAFQAVFTNGKTMPTLQAKIEEAAKTYSDPTVIGGFLDNQDLPRFNSLTSDKTLVYNAIVGTFLYGGIPMIYYGLEQDIADGSSDPANREALWLYNGFSTTATETYGRITTLNKIRKALNGDDGVLKSVATVKDMQDQDIALSRGPALVVLTNRGSSGTGSWSIKDSGFQPGSTVVDALSCKTVQVGGDASLPVTWTNGEPFVFIDSSVASSKGLCSSGSPTSSTPSKPTSFQPGGPRSSAIPGEQNLVATATTEATDSTDVLTEATEQDTGHLHISNDGGSSTTARAPLSTSVQQENEHSGEEVGTQHNKDHEKGTGGAKIVRAPPAAYVMASLWALAILILDI